MIISFALTEREFMSGLKTETRRDWSDRQLSLWQKQWDEGKFIHDGWNKVPLAGGKFISKFRLTKRPYRQKLSEMNKENLKAEGGMCSTLEEFCKLVEQSPEKEMSVIHFEKI